MKVKLRPSIIILTILMLMLKQSYIFTLYILSVLIHELAHYFISLKLKYRCVNIELSAFGAVLYGDFDEVLSKDEIVIALAGPLINIIISIVIVAMWWIVPECYTITVDFLYANLGVALMNLLPCYPLDGGRIVVAVLSRRMSHSKALKISIVIGQVISVFLFAMFILSLFFVANFTLGLFAIFIFSSNLATMRESIYKKIININVFSKLEGGMEGHLLVVTSNTTVNQIYKKLNFNYYTIIIVVDEKGTKIQEITQQEFAEIMMNRQSFDTIIDANQGNHLQKQ